MDCAVFGLYCGMVGGRMKGKRGSWDWTGLGWTGSLCVIQLNFIILYLENEEDLVGYFGLLV